MQIGSLVQYTAREGELPSPAIIMRIWPEGTIELHVFHFESATHIRAADPSQVAPVIEASQIEEILADFETVGKRLTELENEMEFLRRMIQEQKPESDTPVTVDASMLDIEEAPAPGSPETMFPELDSDESEDTHVESTSGKGKRRAAWPR